MRQTFSGIKSLDLRNVASDITIRLTPELPEGTVVVETTGNERLTISDQNGETDIEGEYAPGSDINGIEVRQSVGHNTGTMVGLSLGGNLDDLFKQAKSKKKTKGTVIVNYNGVSAITLSQIAGVMTILAV